MKTKLDYFLWHPSLVERLSSFLHNAWIVEENWRNPGDMGYVIKLERIGYDVKKKQNHRRFFLNFQRWACPRVTARLVITPTTLVSTENRLMHRIDEQDRLISLRVQPRQSVLIMKRSSGETRAYLRGDSSLILNDTGEISTHNQLTEVGGRAALPRLAF